MPDSYFDWLEEQARLDDTAERADHDETPRDDFAPLLSDARAAVTAGRLVPHGLESM